MLQWKPRVASVLAALALVAAAVLGGDLSFGITSELETEIELFGWWW